MPSSKPITFTDISFVERLTKQNIFQVLLNLALYLSFVLPLANQVQIPAIQSPWKDFSNEIAVIFLLSGFGFIYWVSGSYIRFWLISVRINIEFYLGILGSWSGISSSKEKSLISMYAEDKSLVRKSELISYLSKTENHFLEKLYEERLEMNIKFNLYKENTVATLTLFSLHFYFESTLYLGISQYLPNFVAPIILFLLLWSAAEPFPEGNEYFYIPENSIREAED